MNDSPPRVLVADDSTVTRRALVGRLKNERIAIVEAASRKDAERIDNGDLTCAVLDLELGDGLGTDVARTLRARQPSLPIAFFTSEPEGAVARDAKTMGPVFAKPGAIGAVCSWVLRHASGASDA